MPCLTSWALLGDFRPKCPCEGIQKCHFRWNEINKLILPLLFLVTAIICAPVNYRVVHLVLLYIYFLSLLEHKKVKARNFFLVLHLAGIVTWASAVLPLTAPFLMMITHTIIILRHNFHQPTSSRTTSSSSPSLSSSPL